jgi:peptidyl-prolyl cis-trans isomerase C
MPRLRRASVLSQLVVAAGLMVLGGMRLARAQDQPAAAPAGSDAVVMTVGDQKITAAEFEKIVSALPPQFQDSLERMGKRGFAEQLANLLSLTQEAQKRKLDQTDEFQRMVEFDRKVLLAQLVMNQIAEELGPVGKEEVDYYYQTHKDDYEQAKVTGIYIPFVPPGSAISLNTQTSSARPQYTEQEAERKALELRARINSGQNMGLLAKAESVHPTAAKSGDFGYIGQSSSGLDPKLVTAIFALQPHVVSAPLKGKGGYYLFRVESRRSQPLDEVAKEIQGSLSIEKLNRRMETLKDTYPVTLDPTYFAESAPSKPAAPATPPAPRAR